MRHYIDDNGYNIDIVLPNELELKFYRLFIQPILIEDTAKIEDSLRTRIFETEWLYYTVVHSYNIAESLGGIGGGPTVDTVFANEPDKRLIVEIYRWWLSQDMYPKEFPLWWHDFLMECWFNCYEFN